ncbi:MAG: type II toxin-antitoxin system PemK/MazF family toxin [Coriobacteriia bacterium]|nr:type II toxin-antitoxin system PemK/MazF family toxin [Coriobacteriia bacterium]
MSPLLEQGDVIEVDFDPTKGHEPARRRPALVVSVGFFNNVLSSLTVVCPITTAANKHPLHIEIPPENPTEGFLCIEQLRSIDISKRNCTKLDGTLDENTMSTVLEAIGGIFGI